MRPSLPALGTLALVGGLLAGCGDADDGPAASDDAEVAAFCERAEELEERFASLDTSTEPSPELFREVSDSFVELAEDAPDEIADDMEALATALSAFADIFEQVDPGDPESLAVLEEEAERLEEESGNLEEASDNVETYFRDECGIDLDQSGQRDASETESDVETELEGDG